MPLASPVRVTNPAVRSIVWPRGSTTSAGSGTSLLVITEEILHEQEARRCQPPAGPVPALEDAKNPYRGEPSAGPANRSDGLDRARRARRGDSPEQGEERGRASTAPANKPRGDDAQSDARHDLAVLLGEDGVKLINEYVVSWAVEEKLADPSVVVADTTAQEAAIPYPNEMGLMAAFVTSVMAASKRAGQVFKKFASTVAKQVKTAGEKLREYRLFAKDKSKAAKDKMVAKMATVIEAINEQLARAIEAAGSTTSRVTKYGVVAREKLTELHQTMGKLVPQIRYWLRTGFVAVDKIISLHIPELYSIVRGKVGKKVEFGLNWGFARLRGGLLLARLAQNRRELQDTKYAVEAVKDHQALFGEAPRAYAYDRGGYSAKNVAALEEIGVKEVGLAPRGRVQWAVSEPTREKLVKERALVEAGIGAVKSSRYNFHRPRAKSTRMMGVAGQLAVLGFNLNKLARAVAERRKMVVVG